MIILHSIFYSALPIGRPKMMIPKEQLENLLSLRLPINEIARSLGVSRPIVYAFIKEHGILYQG